MLRPFTHSYPVRKLSHSVLATLSAHGLLSIRELASAGRSPPSRKIQPRSLLGSGFNFARPSSLRTHLFFGRAHLISRGQAAPVCLGNQYLAGCRLAGSLMPSKKAGAHPLLRLEMSD